MMEGTTSSSSGQSGLTLIGRSSSSFTRIARIFAAEFGVPYTLRVVPSLLSLDARDYGGHPALKVPSLETPQGIWFGASNICRLLSKLARVPRRVIWPEALEQPLTANAQELTLVAMSTEVAWIMSTLAAPASGAPTESPPAVKLRTSLADTLAWLDAHLEPVLAALPRERDLSYLEVALFCLVEHLEFRNVLPVAPYPRLAEFRQRFGERPAAVQTAYRFDA